MSFCTEFEPCGDCHRCTIDAPRIRKRCDRLGHRWVAWSPGADPWCARWFCDAKRPSLVMALIARGVSRGGAGR